MKKVEGFALTNWGGRKFEVYADSTISTSQIVELVREKFRDLDSRFATCTIMIKRIQDNVPCPPSFEKKEKIIIKI